MLSMLDAQEPEQELSQWTVSFDMLFYVYFLDLNTQQLIIFHIQCSMLNFHKRIFFHPF